MGHDSLSLKVNVKEVAAIAASELMRLESALFSSYQVAILFASLLSFCDAH